MDDKLEIINRLDPATRQMVDGLIKTGWQFRDGSWESHHNGDEYDDVEFKSPNMGKFASIDARQWEEVTKEYLLDRDAYHVANEWANNIFHYTSVVTNPLSNALAKYFRKNKSTSIDKLYSTNVEVMVKISSKIKDKPNKVKVSITIE